MATEGSTLVGLLFAASLLSGATAIVTSIAFRAMMADAADEHELMFGVRREGLFFSGLTLGIKAATGLGGFNWRPLATLSNGMTPSRATWG